MVRKTSILVIGFGSLMGVLWYLGYFDMQTELPSQVTSGIRETVEPSAKSWAIFVTDDGTILEGKNHLDILPIASITKLFTAYAAVASESLQRDTWIFSRDIYTEGRSGKLRRGEHMSVRDLLFPLLIESSNDAGTAIDGVLLHERTNEIYALLEVLELASTTVVDATGLSPRNVSNAYELSVFFSYLAKTHPYIIDITRLRMHIDEERGLINNNPAREFGNFIGGKHGYLPEAGGTFVGAFQRPDGNEVGIVILGSEQLYSDIEILLARADAL